jgi:membrane protease YdiL (CAAX protease family)
MRSNTQAAPRLAWFFGLSFVIAWAFWVPMSLGAQNVIEFPHLPFVTGWLAGLSPAIAALWLVARSQGGTGLRGYLRDRLRPGVPLKTYAVALLQPLALVALAMSLQKAVTGAEMKLPEVDWGTLLMFLGIMLFLSLGEELGWRAYALPSLIQRFGFVGSSLLLGTIWGAWHLPKFWLYQPPPPMAVLAFLLQITAASFLFTWLVAESQGSVLPAVLYHAIFNVMATVFPTIAIDWTAVAVSWVFAAVVVLLRAVRIRPRVHELPAEPSLDAEMAARHIVIDR